MGADIYLRSLSEPCLKANTRKFHLWAKKRDLASAANNKVEADRCQKKVEEYYEAMWAEGYFRDSYNGTSLFQRIGLSWWGLPLDKDGYLPMSEMVKLRAKLVEVQIQGVTKEELKASHCTVDDGSNSPAVWMKMFQEKKERLIALLDEGIKRGECLYCSV